MWPMRRRREPARCVVLEVSDGRRISIERLEVGAGSRKILLNGNEVLVRVKEVQC